MVVPVTTLAAGGRGGQRGVALITALLVVALAVVAATAMATRLQIDVRRTANLLHGEQAYAYATAAESWALVILRKDAANSKFDSLDEDWASSLPPIAVEGGVVSGHVTDQAGRFNINSLVDKTGTPVPVMVDYLARLLTVLGLDPALVPAIIDWIDPDITPQYPGGAEDDVYLLRDTPYRAANRQMVDTSELLLVEGFDQRVYAALAPYVTALPESTPINVNTAAPQVLQALSANITAQDIESLLAQREQSAFPDAATFLSNPLLPAGIDAALVAVTSNWFAADIEVLVGSGRARVHSLLERQGTKVGVRSRTRLTDRLLPAG